MTTTVKTSSARMPGRPRLIFWLVLGVLVAALAFSAAAQADGTGESQSPPTGESASETGSGGETTGGSAEAEGETKTETEAETTEGGEEAAPGEELEEPPIEEDPPPVEEEAPHKTEEKPVEEEAPHKTEEKPVEETKAEEVSHEKTVSPGESSTGAQTIVTVLQPAQTTTSSTTSSGEATASGGVLDSIASIPAVAGEVPTSSLAEEQATTGGLTQPGPAKADGTCSLATLSSPLAGGCKAGWLETSVTTPAGAAAAMVVSDEVVEPGSARTGPGSGREPRSSLLETRSPQAPGPSPGGSGGASAAGSGSGVASSAAFTLVGGPPLLAPLVLTRLDSEQLSALSSSFSLIQERPD